MMATIRSSNRRSLVLELVIVTAALVIAARGLFLARGISAIGPWVPAIVAVLFLYVPILVLWRRRRPIDFLDRGWRKYLRSVVVFIVTAVIVFPPFLAAAHGWQILVLDHYWIGVARFSDFWAVAAFQIFLVALPEEFYFRGYFQSTIDRLFVKRWRILGVRLGWGWIITAAVFAFAHSVVVYQWWHFAIFFPALLFGYLRERTGSITAPLLFHAASNLLTNWLVRCYV
jgi:membrane protease YdiL (CAAX protease family)